MAEWYAHLINRQTKICLTGRYYSLMASAKNCAKVGHCSTATASSWLMRTTMPSLHSIMISPSGHRPITIFSGLLLNNSSFAKLSWKSCVPSWQDEAFLRRPFQISSEPDECFFGFSYSAGILFINWIVGRSIAWVLFREYPPSSDLTTAAGFKALKGRIFCFNKDCTISLCSKTVWRPMLEDVRGIYA